MHLFTFFANQLSVSWTLCVHQWSL